MRCSNCKKIVSINGFGGYYHYVSTKKSLDANVCNGYFNVIEQTQFEIVYQCKECHTIWALAEPDFPVTGYLEQR